jgi:hypothetical protein
MNVHDIEALARIMVDYRLAEISTGDLREGGGVTLKKSIHELEQPEPMERKQPSRSNPIDEEPSDDEVLFHSSYEPRRTVADLVTQAKIEKERADA